LQPANFFLLDLGRRYDGVYVCTGMSLGVSYASGWNRSVAGGTSSGVHESQSRLWENLVGRSRGFWQFFYPKLQETFPDQLKTVSLDTFYRAINKVERSLIRTDADEVTYNLHIVIRFDFELAMLEGKLAVRDLPEAWHERYRADLGIAPPDNRDGVLAALREHGIYAGIHYPTPIHLQPAYADLGYGRGAFPHAERQAARVLSLPIYPEITAEQIDAVTAVVGRFITNSDIRA
jgi:hypothetical protein